MTMVWVFALLIVGALKEDLEKTLKDQMDQCNNILDFVKSFYDGLPNFDDNRRRLIDPEDSGVELEDDVEKSLDTCMNVAQAVNKFFKHLRDGYVEIDADDSDDPWKDPIILNVGGKHFATSLATLRSDNGTVFYKMFRNGSNTTCSADGTFFIDRSPAAFEYTLDFLRTGDMQLESGDTDLRLEILEDAEFFELPEELKKYLRYSALVGIDLSMSEVSWLNKELPGNYKMGGLLFDTSKDGDSASTFHSLCDGEGPTVTIVETTLGVVFGGFTVQSWSSGNGAWSTDTNAFVFVLRPSPFRKFRVSSSTTAIYRHSSYGPQFGNIAFRIYHNCQDNADSYVGSGSYYSIGSYVLNDGSQDFRVKDYALVQAVV